VQSVCDAHGLVSQTCALHAQLEWHERLQKVRGPAFTTESGLEHMMHVINNTSFLRRACKRALSIFLWTLRNADGTKLMKLRLAMHMAMCAIQSYLDNKYTAALMKPRIQYLTVSWLSWAHSLDTSVCHGADVSGQRTRSQLPPLASSTVPGCSMDRTQPAPFRWAGSVNELFGLFGNA
jgi:hypothetical protein